MNGSTITVLAALVVLLAGLSGCQRNNPDDTPPDVAGPQTPILFCPDSIEAAWGLPCEAVAALRIGLRDCLAPTWIGRAPASQDRLPEGYTASSFVPGGLSVAFLGTAMHCNSWVAGDRNLGAGSLVLVTQLVQRPDWESVTAFTYEYMLEAYTDNAFLEAFLTAIGFPVEAALIEVEGDYPGMVEVRVESANATIQAIVVAGDAGVSHYSDHPAPYYFGAYEDQRTLLLRADVTLTNSAPTSYQATGSVLADAGVMGQGADIQSQGKLTEGHLELRQRQD